MKELIPILENYNIELGNYNYVKAEKSYKQGTEIYYQSICDGLTLGCNPNLDLVESPIKKRGIMLDLSRGKVFTVETIKKFILKSACLGFNYMTLYIEDLIELPGYPQYGYLRGKFKDQEITEIIEFAESIDYKVIPAFQTLGHLEHFLRWDASDSIRGTDTVLDPLSADTYKFIDVLIKRMVELFGPECLNIGMDEAFDLGFNYFNSKQLDQKKMFLNHLKKVVEICDKYEVQTIKMWSDMLFSIYSNTDGDGLYSMDFKQEVEKIDERIELIYWNYWTKDSAAITKVLESHRLFNDNLSMAGSIHTSMNLVYEHSMLEATKAAFDGSVEVGITDMLFTMWSEDGTNVAIDTIDFGMYETMRVLLDSPIDEQAFEMISGYQYSDLKKICCLKSHGLKTMAIIWNDPIYDIYYKSVKREEVEQFYQSIKKSTRLTSENELSKYYNGLLDYFEYDSKRYLERSNDPELLSKIAVEYKKIGNYIIDQWIENGKLHGIEEVQKRFSLKTYRYDFMIENPGYKLDDEESKVEGFIKPRFIQLYGPNKWRY